MCAVKAGLAEEGTVELLWKQCKASNGTWSSSLIVTGELEALTPQAGATA